MGGDTDGVKTGECGLCPAGHVSGSLRGPLCRGLSVSRKGRENQARGNAGRLGLAWIPAGSRAGGEASFTGIKCSLDGVFGASNELASGRSGERSSPDKWWQSRPSGRLTVSLASGFNYTICSAPTPRRCFSRFQDIISKLPSNGVCQTLNTVTRSARGPWKSRDALSARRRGRAPTGTRARRTSRCPRVPLRIAQANAGVHGVAENWTRKYLQRVQPGPEPPPPPTPAAPRRDPRRAGVGTSFLREGAGGGGADGSLQNQAG